MTAAIADMRLDDRLNDPGLFGVSTCINISGTTCLGRNVSINLNTINAAPPRTLCRYGAALQLVPRERPFAEPRA